jgi:hypothetical protein
MQPTVVISFVINGLTPMPRVFATMGLGVFYYGIGGDSWLTHNFLSIDYSTG